MLHCAFRHHSRLFGTAKVIELVQSNINNIKSQTTRLDRLVKLGEQDQSAYLELDVRYTCIRGFSYLNLCCDVVVNKKVMV